MAGSFVLAEKSERLACLQPGHGARDCERARQYPIREQGQVWIVSWAWIAATMVRHDNALFLRTRSNSHYSDDYVIDRYGVNIA